MSPAPEAFKVPDGLFGLALGVDIQEPATDAEFAWSEQQLGVRLPAELLAVLRVRNGGAAEKHMATRLEAAVARVI